MHRTMHPNAFATKKSYMTKYNIVYKLLQMRFLRRRKKCKKEEENKKILRL